MNVARACLALVLALGVLAPSAPVGAQSRARKPPRIGYLSGSEPATADAFRGGLRDLGYVDGQNIVVEYRFASGQYDKLPGFARELVRLEVALIVAATTPAIRAAQQATPTIPIVMAIGEAAEGSIVSLARPGSNVTGVSTVNTELSGKRLELLKEALPRLSRVAALYNSANPISAGQVKSMEAAARALGVQLHLAGVKRAQDFEAAFEAAARAHADALMGLPDQLMTAERKRLADLAVKHRMPTMYASAALVESGGLMSYGPLVGEMGRRAASYVDRILKGARAAELPIEQPTQFVFVINARTARALGLTIPASLLVRADRVIE